MHFPNLVLKRLYLWNHSSYELQNLAGIFFYHPSDYNCCKLRAPPTFGMGGASAHVDRVRKMPFYALLWRLTAWDRRLAQTSNVGSVK